MDALCIGKTPRIYNLRCGCRSRVLWWGVSEGGGWMLKNYYTLAECLKCGAVWNAVPEAE